MTSSIIEKRTNLLIPHAEISSRILGISLFTFLTILGAKLEFPAYPVPFTLQTFFVLLSGAFLGKRDGATSQLLYLLLGASGLPVFAGSIAGLSKLFGPTGGYLIAFPFASYITGLILEYKHGLLISILSLSIGTFCIFSIGVFFLDIFFLHDITRSVMLGLVVFSIWEVIKIIVASIILSRFE